MAHTPGPWLFNGRRITTGAFIVADIWNADEPVGQGNAHLIAAAPELLDALKAIKEVMNDIATEQCEAGINVEYWNRTNGHGWQVANQVSAAIAKATGEQQ